MTPVPAVVSAEGRLWQVGRAWPAVDGGHDLELSTPGAPGVRAGRWRAGRAVLEQPAGDARLPALAAVAGAGEIVSWRRGRRAVVRERAGGAFVKVVRPHAAAGVLRAHTEAAAFRDGFTVPEPLPASPTDEPGVVRLSLVPGRTLCDLGADDAVPDALVDRAWHAWAAGWRRVLARSAVGMRRHGPRDEAAVLRSWALAAAPLADDAEGLAAHAETVAARLVDGAAQDAVVGHRDLHDKQVLFDDSGDPAGAAGLIDLDTAAAVEPALDLANLRVHVAWREAQSRLSAQRAASARAAIDALAAAVGVDPERMRVYEDATRLRLGAVYLFRPQWHDTAQAWLRASAASQTRR
ncbi:hypothetical protein [Microbacterium oleivorans]|uniref:Aminoglycoside phosphotransferase domain-containing protein n=1 Tax=Microbacterium oleivorans TaxID=273677 RepID=A0A7D5ISE2_9MICO|nr:hypothetical protein [Microbacterium oleivorans]QLD11517.1 hypothetical protein HW566_06860 [Microbacterium oleivorans]